MSEPRKTADTITDDELDALYERAATYQAAWHSARHRVRALSDELTRRAPLTGQYAAAIERVRAYCNVRDTEARRLTGESTAVDVFAEIIRHKLDEPAGTSTS